MARLGAPMLLIQLAKGATMVGASATILVLFLIVRWEARLWAAEGRWQNVQISDVVDLLRTGENATYLPASIEGLAETRSRTALLSPFGDLPAIVPLVLALAVLIIFYLWLRRAAQA